MDKGLSSKTIPEAPKTTEKGFKGGVIQGFPVTKNATPNEVGENGEYSKGSGCKN